MSPVVSEVSAESRNSRMEEEGGWSWFRFPGSHPWDKVSGVSTAVGDSRGGRWDQGRGGKGASQPELSAPWVPSGRGHPPSLSQPEGQGIRCQTNSSVSYWLRLFLGLRFLSLLACGDTA